MSTCHSASHSFESKPARNPTLVTWLYPVSGQSLNPHGTLSKSFSTSWISGLHTIVSIHPCAFFHFSFCSITSIISSQKLIIQSGNCSSFEPTGASIDQLPLNHPRVIAISKPLSHALGGTWVLWRSSGVQFGACFDKQDSGERRTSCNLRGRSVTMRWDTAIVSAGICWRISLGTLFSC